MFYLINVHQGDDNDNHISDLIVEADSREEALDICERLFKENFDGDLGDLIEDGDDSYAGFMWYEGGNPDSEDDEERYGIPYHEDFHIDGEFNTLEEAESGCSCYHGRWIDVFKTNDSIK